MKHRFGKRIFCIIACSLLLSAHFATKVSANSAQTRWSGVDAAGTMVLGDNCPIEVEHELLTLELMEFPLNYYRDAEEFLAYTGSVTAEYTFYNPTDLTVTATLAFPFGAQPDYAPYDPDAQSVGTYADTQKYAVTVNGEMIERKLRYTLRSDLQFDLEGDLPRLCDGYTSDPFYSPDMTVTKYTYIVGGANKEGQIDEGNYRAAAAAFDWDGGDGKTRILFLEQSGFHLQKDGDARLSDSVENGSALTVYAIGEPLSKPISWKCYEDGGVKDKEEIEGTVALISTETMTLEALALSGFEESRGVSSIDWYNAVIDSFNSWRGSNEFNYVSADFGFLDSERGLMSSLMRWYEYEITLAPKERIVNTVSAPIYPEINSRYVPAIYSYTYLLSPASTWARFGELEIVIHTPYYITENTVQGFEKTETGYSYKQNGLPSTELAFTLCTDPSPIAPKSGVRGSSLQTVIYIAVAVAIVGGTSAVFVWFLKCKRG